MTGKRGNFFSLLVILTVNEGKFSDNRASQEKINLLGFGLPKSPPAGFLP